MRGGAGARADRPSDSTRNIKMNFETTFTQRHNAARALRKAVAAGKCEAGAYTVAPVNGGFRIVEAERVAPTFEADEPRKPDLMATAMALLADEAEPVVEPTPEFVEAFLGHEPVTSPGMARLQASGQAEDIRQDVLADRQAALSEAAERRQSARKARKEAVQQERDAKARKVERAIAKLAAPEAAKPAPKGEVSLDGVTYLGALRRAVTVGEWVDQKAVAHGFEGRKASGVLAGLSRKKLIEVRADKGGKYSARLTAAGAALVQEDR
jgi:hypothetical protein